MVSKIANQKRKINKRPSGEPRFVHFFVKFYRAGLARGVVNKTDPDLSVQRGRERERRKDQQGMEGGGKEEGVMKG